MARRLQRDVTRDPRGRRTVDRCDHDGTAYPREILKTHMKCSPGWYTQHGAPQRDGGGIGARGGSGTPIRGNLFSPDGVQALACPSILVSVR